MKRDMETRRWTRKFKGSRSRGGAFIHTHPDALDGRAVVENCYGVQFNGKSYPTLDAAKSAALSQNEQAEEATS